MKKRVSELEAKLSESVGDETDGDKKKTKTKTKTPDELIKKPIMISEYSDAFLLTGKGTYNIKNLLKEHFNAMWSPDCKGWKIFKVTDDMIGGGEKPGEMLVSIREIINDSVSKIDYVRDNIERSFSDLYG